ncbi:PKD domain-containing protein [Methanogenium cariaci]
MVVQYRRSLLFLLLLSLLATGVVAADGPQIILDAADATLEVGETTTVAVVMDAVPSGLSGFNITVSLTEPSVAEIVGVSYPPWANMPVNSSLPADTVYAQAIDLMGSIGAGATNLTLCTLTLRGDTPGTTNLSITAAKIDDDVAGRYASTTASTPITVGDIPAPTPTPTPTPSLRTGLSFSPVDATIVPGERACYALVMDTAPTGLSGFNITVSLTEPSVAEIVGVSYPPWANMPVNGSLPADTVYAQAIDLMGSIGAGATNLTLCTLTLRGDTPGTTNLSITAAKIDDDVAGRYAPTTASTSITVGDTPTPSFRTGLSFSPVDATIVPGERACYALVMDTAPAGLSGFNITVSLTEPYVADIVGVSYPPWAIMPVNGSLPADSVYVQAVDLMGSVDSGVTNLTLCNLTIRGDAPGTTNLSITATKIDDDVAGRYSPETTDVCLRVETLSLMEANFTANITTGTAPLTVQFTDTSTGTPTSWSWNFGDGATSTDQNPTHTYQNAGTYDVTLTVSNAEGTDSLTKHEYISVTNMSPSVSTIELPLSPGWNMISIPITDANLTLPPEVSDVIYTYNPEVRSYVASDIATLEPCRGYWVAATAECTIRATGTELNCYGANLTPGWNMIGSVYDPVAFDDLQVTPEGAVQMNVYLYNPQLQSYQLTSTLSPGSAYWVSATRYCNLNVS